MDGLFDKSSGLAESFGGFGPSPFVSRRAAARTIELADDARVNRRSVREVCPSLPGVYGMVDRSGELIYIGMSVRLRDRLLTYFTKGRPDAKEQRIAGHAARLIWEVGDHELTVRLRELELIRRWCPRFNARGRPGRQEIGYIYLTGGEAPHLRMGRRVPSSAHHCWGPLPLSRHVRAAVRQLNLHCRLRDCPERTRVRYADQLTLLDDVVQPACLRGEIGTCLAPCSGQRARADYYASIAEARALLDGRETQVMDHYESAMQEAADRLAYEQAASFRDTWEQLSVLHDQLRALREAQRDLWFVYPIASPLPNRARRSRKWILIAGGRIAAVVREPQTAAGARRCIELMQESLMVRRPMEPEEVDQVRVVAAWFRQHPEERERVLQPDEAHASCAKRLQVDS